MMSTNQVIRVRKKTGFTILDNGIFRDTLLSMKAKGLLATLLSLPEDWNFSTLGLAKLCNDGEGAVRSALKELEQNGYLNREAIREKGTIIDWKYTIYEERQPKDFTKKPDVSSPDVKNSHVPNPPQLNTNKSSTKELSNKVSTKVDTSPTEGGSISNTETMSHASVNQTKGSRIKSVRTPQKVLTKEKKPNLYERCTEEVAQRYEGELKYVLLEYLNYRIKSKLHPLGFSAWKGMLNKLDKLAEDDKTRSKVVEQSLKMGWDTFVELKEWNKKPAGRALFGETTQIKSKPFDPSQLSDVEF